MKNYRELIKQLLDSHFGGTSLADDANAAIDSLLFNTEGLDWYPPYLAQNSNKEYYLFLPFSFENYLDIDELREECENAERLLRRLEELGGAAKLFFIARSIEDQRVLESISLPPEFDILYQEDEEPRLIQSAKAEFGQCRVMMPVIRYLAEPKALRESPGQLASKFAKNYAKKPPKPEEEEKRIRVFMDRLLKCDARFCLSTRLVETMASVERLLAEHNYRLRDHFFHACNTLLMGYMVIDKFYDRFSLLNTKYGEDISLEFAWTLTALYHDMGYPASLQSNIVEDTYWWSGDTAIIEGCVRQMRQKVWDAKYEKAAHVLSDLFSHVYEGRKGRWVFDGFPRKTNVRFIDALKTAFIDKGAHGAQGALILVSLIDDLIVDLQTHQDREVFYRHIVIAALSILFHDYDVRMELRGQGIAYIKIAEFPLAGLLTYLDILQDDRRDLSGSVCRSDIFVDIIEDADGIRASLDSKALVSETRQKLGREMEEALAFFIMNGVTFLMPKELAA